MSRPKSYGDEKTHLVLTDNAYDAYSGTDPLDILEYEDEDGNFTYSFRGAIVAVDLSADSVNRLLEELFDECYCVKVFIPDTEQYMEMMEHFQMNNYNIEYDTAKQTMTILVDEYSWAETCFEDHGINYIEVL